MSEVPETLHFVIDSEDMDPGSAFLRLDRKAGTYDDPRLEGRFGRQDGKVYLETYDSGELKIRDREFKSVFVTAASRRAAVVKVLRELGYPRGTNIEIRYER